MTKTWVRGAIASALIAGALLVASIMLAGCGSEGDGGDKSPGSTSEGAVGPVNGEALYLSYCASCHGVNGEGQPNSGRQNPDRTYPAPPHDSTGHTWHHGDGNLFRLVRDGGQDNPAFKSAMPAFGESLAPGEIRAVIEYIKTFWGQTEREAQARRSEVDPFPQPGRPRD